MVDIDRIYTQRNNRDTLQKPNTNRAADMLRTIAIYGRIEWGEASSSQGGHCDYDGLSNCRGGSNRTALFHRNGQTDVTQRRDARLQSWEGVAYRPTRVRGMVATTQEQVSKTSTGSVNWPVLPEAYSSHVSFHAASNEYAAVRRSIESRHVYYSGWRQNRQERDRECLVFMPTTSIRSRTSEREVTM